jgi:hypothetical protein
MSLAGDTVPMLATAEADEDMRPAVTDPISEEHAEITLLCGECFDFFLHASY